MNAPSEPVRATAGTGRRLLAVLCNAALLVLVGVAAVRYVADITQEQIPASMTAAGADVCATLDQQVTTTWCEVRGDRVYYSSVSHPFLRAALPPLAVSFANSVLLSWLTGASIGKHLVGLRVVRRRDGRRAGLLTQLLRWPLWPVTSLGAQVVRTGARPTPDAAATTVTAEPPTVVPDAPAEGPVVDLRAPAPAPDPLPVVDPARPVARPTAPAESWWPFADADTPAGADADTPSGTEATGSTDTVREPATAAPPDPAPAAPADAAAAAGPRWDPARQAYIQWEPVSMRWMTYDATAERWIPLTEGS